jgi:hypothetical protein
MLACIQGILVHGSYEVPIEICYMEVSGNRMEPRPNLYWKLKNTHLIISSFVVIPIALAYGISPSQVLPFIFDFEVQTVDLTNIFRAIMCVYIGNVCIWILGILNPAYWTTATVMNIVFMGGLALGRIISWICDGQPSTLFTVGLFGETVLFLHGLSQLKRYSA